MSFLSETADDIQKRIYNILDDLTPADFDYHHVRHVLKYSIQLAHSRGMDLDIARIIALLHDSGRIIGGVYGSGHAMEGALITGEWLTEYQMDADTIELITTSISVHNKKKKIHDPYSELIKDADSIAHLEEFGGDISPYEFVRAGDALLKPLSFDLNKDMDINKSVKKRVKLIKELVRDMSSMDISDKRVHDFRVLTRRIRAMLWLCKGKKWEKTEKRYNVMLRDSFKMFERARELAVLNILMKDLGLSKEERMPVKKMLEAEKEYLRGQLPAIYKVIDAHKIPGLKVTQKMSKKKILFYRDTLLAVNTDDIETLHQFRILGKKFKYLLEEDVFISREPVDYQMIVDMHELIGDLNDLRVNDELIHSLSGQEAYATLVQEYALLDSELANKEAQLIKQIKLQLFRMKKRWISEQVQED
jgi:HD superfamily phosphodiesterase